MRRRALLVGLVCSALPRVGNAQMAVVCPTCDQFWQQIVSWALQVKSYANDLLKYGTQLQQYQNMITNTVSLPIQIFSTVQADIGQVRAIIDAASLLTGNSGTILQKLQMAGGLISEASYLPNGIANQFSMWQQTLGNASQTLGNVLAKQQLQQAQYAGVQAGIQAQSELAVGQKQTMQAAVSAISLANTQLNQVQGTLTAAYQESTTRDIIAANRQQMQDQQYLSFIADPNMPLTGYPRY
jgi:P-type conjugative transfer protein TrbJ